MADVPPFASADVEGMRWIPGALFRAVVDGRFKLVRWFSPLEYGNPGMLQELYERSDVTFTTSSTIPVS